MSKLFLSTIFGTALLFSAVGCDVDQTQEGRMPDVDVSAEPGAMPAYDVEGPEVDVTSEERSVTVPDVDVNSSEEQITVPDVDVTLPSDE